MEIRDITVKYCVHNKWCTEERIRSLISEFEETADKDSIPVVSVKGENFYYDSIEEFVEYLYSRPYTNEIELWCDTITSLGKHIANILQCTDVELCCICFILSDSDYMYLTLRDYCNLFNVDTEKIDNIFKHITINDFIDVRTKQDLVYCDGCVAITKDEENNMYFVGFSGDTEFDNHDLLPETLMKLFDCTETELNALEKRILHNCDMDDETYVYID